MKKIWLTKFFIINEIRKNKQLRNSLYTAILHYTQFLLSRYTKSQEQAGSDKSGHV